MQLVSQLSVFLVNKPGVLAQIARQIAVAKVNILAMTMADSSEHGVLRLVAEEPEKLRAALSKLNLPTTETEVLVVNMANKPGALAEVCTRLADAHVNIGYAYCTTGAAGGRTQGVFKVADSKKAMRVLKSREPKQRDTRQGLRRPPTQR